MTAYLWTVQFVGTGDAAVGVPVAEAAALNLDLLQGVEGVGHTGTATAREAWQLGELHTQVSEVSSV